MEYLGKTAYRWLGRMSPLQQFMFALAVAGHALPNFAMYAENAGRGKLAVRLRGIAEVSVVGQREAPFQMIHLQRLAVRPAGCPGGGIAYMPDSHASLRHRRKDLRSEHFAHQAEILFCREKAAVVHNDTAALLAAVLQGIESMIYNAG